jgi:hypothetical protein
MLEMFTDDPVLLGGAVAALAGLLLATAVVVARVRGGGTSKKDKKKGPKLSVLDQIGEDGQLDLENLDLNGDTDDADAGGGVEFDKKAEKAKAKADKKAAKAAKKAGRRGDEDDDGADDYGDYDELAAAGTFVPPKHGQQMHVIANPHQVVGDPAAALTWAASEVRKLAKQADGLLKRWHDDDPPEFGQAELAAAVNRLDFVVDSLRDHESKFAGKQRKMWHTVEAEIETLVQHVADLLLDAPGDTIQALPIGWPAAFASHVPASGVVELSEANTDVFNLLGIIPPTIVAVAPRTVASAPALMSQQAGPDALEGLDELSQLGEDVDDVDGEESRAKAASRSRQMWKTMDLPEPLPSP